jgi:hypothetical protein
MFGILAKKVFILGSIPWGQRGRRHIEVAKARVTLGSFASLELETRTKQEKK